MTKTSDLKLLIRTKELSIVYLDKHDANVFHKLLIEIAGKRGLDKQLLEILPVKE